MAIYGNVLVDGNLVILFDVFSFSGLSIFQFLCVGIKKNGVAELLLDKIQIFFVGFTGIEIQGFYHAVVLIQETRAVCLVFYAR